MKPIHTVLLAGLLCAAPTSAFAKTDIFACEPEWASLAKEIGGDMVEVYAATNAMQDPHHIRAKPSLIATMRKADLVICSGAGLEVGWLPVLLQKAGNSQVQTGGDFSIMAADHVAVLEKPEKVDRSMGDVHPEGNPHVHLNPHNILAVAHVLNEKLQKLEPEKAAAYQMKHDAFTARWKQMMQKWEQEGRSLKGQKVIAHHKSWSYLIDWLGLDLVNTLEPKPGVPPSTGHLEDLLQQVRSTKVAAIIRTPYDPDDASQWLAAKSGVPAIELPYTIGGDSGATDLFSLFDTTLTKLGGAHAQR